MLLYLMCSFANKSTIEDICRYWWQNAFASIQRTNKSILHKWLQPPCYPYKYSNSIFNFVCIFECIEFVKQISEIREKAHLILEWWVMLTSRSVTVDFVKKWMDKCVEMESFRIESHRFVYEQNYWSEWRALKL